MALVRTGGESDKLGNYYEALWRLKLLLELIAGEAEMLVLEGFDRTRSIGVDAEITRLENGVLLTEFHSVKRQTTSGVWTTGRMANQGDRSPLPPLVSKIIALSTPARGVFVSTDSVELLPGLADAARRSQNVQVLMDRFRHGSRDDQVELAGLFRNLVRWLKLTEDQCLETLKELRFRAVLEPDLEDDVARTIRKEIMRLDGSEVDESAVAEHLAEFMRLNLGGQITRALVLDFLREIQPGYCEKNLSRVPSAIAQLGAQNQRFVREAEPRLIRSSRILRAETDIVVNHLLAPTREWVMLTGNAGSGKSCVLAQVVDKLKANQITCFAFRFDTAAPVDSVAKLKECLDVKWDPIGLLDNIAKRGKSVLIIDQVDALSDVAGRRNGQQWQVLYRLIEEAREYPNMSILLACRSFDLENDAELKSLLRSERGNTRWPEAKKVEVGPLSHIAVKECLNAEGIETQTWSTTDLDVLTVPLHLELFLQCKGSDASPVASLSALYGRYLSRLRADAACTVPPWNLNAALGPIVACFSDYQAVAIEWRTIESRGLTSQASRLISCGILSDQGVGEQRLVRFFHDTLFDHAFASAFLEGGDSLTYILTRPGERQELFRRTHCRQVLTFLRNGSPHERSRYLVELESLLTSPEIRVHLKLFLLVWLNALPNPTNEEWCIVQTVAKAPLRTALSKRQKREWWQFVLRLATWNRVPWFDLLHREGLWLRWMEGNDGDWGNQLCWMLGREEIMKARCDIVVAMLRSLPGRDSKLRRRRAAQLLSWGEFYRSEATAHLFADAFVQQWPGLDKEGIWQSHLKLLPQGSEQAALKVLQCIVLKRLRLKKSTGRLMYISRPLNWRQMIKERYDDWKEAQRWNHLVNEPQTRLGKAGRWLRLRWQSLKQRLSMLPTKQAGELFSRFWGVDLIKQSAQALLCPPINHQRLDGHNLAEFIFACANYIPLELCDTIVSFIERLKTEQPDRAHSLITHWWTDYSSLDNDPSAALISALNRSLRKLAETKPLQAEPVIDRLLRLSIPGLDRIVMQVWGGNPGHFVPRVLPFFREDPLRLFAQPSVWSGGNALSFYARMLLRETGPALSDSDFAEIESMILHANDPQVDSQSIMKRFIDRHGHPPDKRNPQDRAQLLNWLKWRDRGRHTLLSVLPESRLSIAARRKLTVWESRYGKADMSPPGGIECRSIGAPIENEKLAKMNDAQVLEAMRSYPSTRAPDTPMEWSRDALVGQFRKLASSQKRRFLSLIQSFPVNIEIGYRHAIIEGLLGRDHEGFTAAENNELSVEEITELITPIGTAEDNSLAKAICWNLRRPDEQFPRSWLNILLDLALNHPDPASPNDDQSSRRLNGGERVQGHDLMTNGINHVRGAACNALAKALFDDLSIADVLRPQMPRIITDRSMGVRASVIDLLIAWLNVNRDEAVRWFIVMVTENDVLLHCPIAEHFLGYACQTHLDQLEPMIDRMTCKLRGEAQVFGVCQTTRASFITSHWKPKVERLLRHRDPDIRKSIADTVAGHWPIPRFRDQSEQWLRLAFNDRVPTVCESAAHVFRYVPDDDWKSCDSLTKAFADSRALLSAAETLIWKIDDAKPVPVDLIIHIASRSMIEWKRHTKESKKLEKLRWGSHGLPKLVLHAYHNCVTSDQKIQCLNLFDDMLVEGFFGITDLVQGSE